MTQAFNLSQLANNVNSSGLLNAAAGLYNQTPVANGGTGVATVASGNLLVGAGTAAMTALAGTSAGQVVTWSGTAWAAAASAGGPAPVVTIYTSPAPWTKNPTLKGIKVTLISGGGAGGSGGASGSLGGGGGAVVYGSFAAPAIPGPVTVTVGAGGTVASPSGSPSTFASGNPGGASSFGAVITATGGGGAIATPNPIGANRGITAGVGGSFTPSPSVWGQNGYPAYAYAFGNQPGAGSPITTWFQGGPSGFGIGSGIVGLTASLVYTAVPYPAASAYISSYGSGGAGGSAPSIPTSTNTAGNSGIVIVEEFY